MVRHSSRIELSLAALKQNINFIRKKIGTDAIFSSVVKADAFGHGIGTFVPMAEKAGIRHFSVASSYEAWEVSEARTKESTIMIMGILYDDDMEWVIKNEVEFFVFDLPRLKKAKAAAEMIGKKAIIHLEVETGGNRTGLEESKLDEALEYIKQHSEWIRFEGFCTHYAGIESLSNQFRTRKQLDKFEKLYERTTQSGIEPNLKHTACSAAALAFPETVMDLVRIGTAHYGMWPSPDIYNVHLQQTGKKRDAPLKRVLTWKTDVMHIKEIKKDEFVGYGTSYQAPRDMKIAVLPLGYSNGYPRTLSNRGEVIIRGKKAPVVGLINMNVFMVDVSHNENVEVGDEVVLIGRQKNHVISIRSFSEFTNAINNELVSRLPDAIPRVAVK
ncbi:alanine racemase [Rhodohalobacter sp. SW132]|uniref:alanine racemase n=1 Tax=Rhodohalobacter sp. SW132 TaxID=2293433 RepID=UPI000E236F58|nr:alanine racemase [Rhodohalobacter sp. SW132]REL39189.1 alanine racemase [Rhodohalobacter sp. SW132]